LRQPKALISFETPKSGFPFQMTESFFSIATPATGTYKEKGSKFIAFAHPVTETEQIKTVLDGLKKEYFDASHHCYAWILGPDKKLFRAFDDGEPNHSAGDPILGQIRSKNLTNVLVVVVRYFGGTKLGVSGLISAYREATALALGQASVIEKFITEQFTLKFGYADTSLVLALLKEFDGEMVEQEFTDSCKIVFNLRVKQVKPLLSRVNVLLATGLVIQLKQEQAFQQDKPDP
jgi:uncharacterized YigZ family protein